MSKSEFHKKTVTAFMVHFQTNFHMSTSNNSAVIAIRELNKYFAEPLLCCFTLYKKTIALTKVAIFQRSITITIFEILFKNGTSVSPTSQRCTTDRKFRSTKVEWSYTTFHENLLTNSKGWDNRWTH
jgi:hypothetical protein